eukprot:gnl/TRDRNA2_/TRDRNA2_136428_c0_seq1.p1 gnl/TRDRNA2_/TRDRNA2_136428_c0~~gnl/TRDRNA2_/TRDRNA2_136428_c0_seq1.p1  ORF type:complete len:429 (-),score=92.55 gnl/TRDRNA2_/TRDRNA2_136428_c0_seq1:87-1373(-)
MERSSSKKSGQEAKYQPLVSTDSNGDLQPPGPRKSIFKRILDTDVTSNEFNMVIGIVIVINALVIGLETDLGADRFIVLEHIFMLIFVTEAALRIRQLGFYDYITDRWNCFDAFLIVTGAFDLYVIPVLMKDTSLAQEMSMFRLLRILRVLRVIRVFRMFRELTLISQAFIKAFSTTLVISIVVVILDFVCAVFLTQLVGHHAALWGEHEHLIITWFGNIGSSMRTLFIVMTLADWDHIAMVLMEVLPPIPVFVFFVLYILVASYTMVSLITGVISESLISAENEDQQHRMQEIEEDRQAFAADLKEILAGIDTDGSGELTHDEVKIALEGQPEVITKLWALEIHLDMKGILEIVDRLSEGKKGVSIDMFVDTMTHMTGDAKASMVFELKHLVMNHVSQMKSQMGELHRKLDIVTAGMEKASSSSGPS